MIAWLSGIGLKAISFFFVAHNSWDRLLGSAELNRSMLCSSQEARQRQTNRSKHISMLC